MIKAIRSAIGKSQIQRILVISLTNLGDVILTFPVLDILKRDFPEAELSVVIGPKAESLLTDNPHFKKIYIFDKHKPALEKFHWMRSLRRERFDLVVDLRNTMIPFFLGAKHQTPLAGKDVWIHKKHKHLNRLQTVWPFSEESKERWSVYIREEDRKSVDQMLSNKFEGKDKFVVIGPGAADQAKRWHDEGFSKVCQHIQNHGGRRIVLVGDERDRGASQKIIQNLKNDVLDLCGQTNLRELAEILKRSRLAIVNDSGIMHLASYLDVRVVALFGPTDPRLYGPWSSQSSFVKRGEAMNAIQAEDVLQALRGNI